MIEKATDGIETKIASLFSGQKLGVLSTCGKNGPYANLISFASTDGLRRILFVTPKTTQKYANIQEDPRVAMLVENSQNKMADFEDAMAVTATGRTKELIGEARRRMIDRFLEKHPNLAAFANAKDNALMEIEVNAYVLVEKFQSVKKINL